VMRRRGAAAIAAALMVLAAARGAQAGNPERAEEAFQRGRTFLEKREYAQACRSFEESQLEDPASGTLLALAYCQELSGLLASAYKNYRAAAELAQTEGQSERHQAATQQSKALEQRVSALTIVVPENVAGVPGLRVTLDGVEVARSRFGTPIPVNGGTYRVEAVAGKAAWSAAVSVHGERDYKTLVVELILSQPESRPAPASMSPRSAAPPSHRAPDPPRSLEYVSLGLALGGSAALVGGIAFGIRAQAKNRASNRDGHCDARGCDARGIELRNEAFSAAHTATWLSIASGALVAGAAGLYVGTTLGWGRSSARVDANIGPSTAGVIVTERF
jgi:hypothetical protein